MCKALAVPTSRRSLLAAAMAAVPAYAVLARPADRAYADGVTPSVPTVVPTVGSPAVGSPLAGRVRIGAYVHLAGHPFADPVAPADLATFESALGRRLDLVHYFFTWGRDFAEALNPNAGERALMLSMKPDGSLVPDIAAGRQDGYLDRFARDARDSGREIYLRFGHEMNGQWMSYSAGAPDGSPAYLFVRAWRRLVDRFRAQGAGNVRFVWCPNESDFPDRPGNRLEDYWPGEDHVDIAGFDAYNWSNQEPARGDGSWRSFEQLVAGPYERITRLTSRPVWLGEFGTTEAVSGVDPVGADKGDWFRDMFASTRFPRLEALVYFSEDDRRDVQRDWRVESSAASLLGFRDGWAGEARQGPGVATVTSPLVLAKSGWGSVTASFTVSNTGASPLSVDYFLAGARTSWGANVDFPTSAPMTLAPGRSYAYSASRWLGAGSYTSWPACHNGSDWIELTAHRSFTLG